MEGHQKTIGCKRKGIRLDGTQKEHYYEKNNKHETQKKYYESAKYQYCDTYAKQMKKWGKSLVLKTMGINIEVFLYILEFLKPYRNLS